MHLLKNKLSVAMLGTSVLLFSFAFLRVHVLMKTTMIGYEIAELKSDEENLLETRSRLKMDIEKLTTKNHLSLISDNHVTLKTSGDIAAR